MSDQGSAVIKRFGILNTTVDPSNAQFGYPFPGTFIVDRRGVVTSRFFEPAYQERSTISSVLVRLGNNVNVPATKISSPNLEITSYATDEAVAPGTHFSVVLDIKPGPRVHVYAPEVEGRSAEREAQNNDRAVACTALRTAHPRCLTTLSDNACRSASAMSW